MGRDDEGVVSIWRGWLDVSERRLSKYHRGKKTPMDGHGLMKKVVVNVDASKRLLVLKYTSRVCSGASENEKIVLREREGRIRPLASADVARMFLCSYVHSQDELVGVHKPSLCIYTCIR